jgi:uncharacterized protein YndB with AHSA1/START domain
MTEALALRKQIIVSRTPEEAFRIFTDGIASWWPRKTHSLSGEHTESVAIEGRVGGRVYETDDSGSDHLWGTVTAWDPPNLVAFTWHLGNDESRENVEVRFEPHGDGTLVTLVHDGWESRARDDGERFRNYDTGWDYVFGECFGGAAGTL